MCDTVEEWGVGVVNIIVCSDALCDERPVKSVLAKSRPAAENGFMPVHHDSAGCECAACGLNNPASQKQLREIYAAHWPNSTTCDCRYCVAKNYPAAKHATQPVPFFRRHPTLLEIAQRHQEIEVWEAQDAPSPRWGVHAIGVGCLGLAAGLLVPALWIVGIAGCLTVLAGVVLIAVRHSAAPRDPRPEPLKVVPFSMAENRYLLGGQEREPFRAFSACPGCGDVEPHSIRLPDTGEPAWAAVVRSCGVCCREWAQL